MFKKLDKMSFGEEVFDMAFKAYTLKEIERRTYTLTMWPRTGEIITPKGGIIDYDNDIRLFYYGNGPYREASKEYQFIYDYKGTVMNINIAEEIKDNDIYYSLIEIEGTGSLDVNDIKSSLSEAICLFGYRRYFINEEFMKDKIHTDF